MFPSPTISCPACGQPIVLGALRNNRSGRWVALPLDPDECDEGPFVALDVEHDTVDLAGQSAGVHRVVEYRPGTVGCYRTHPPSHFALVDHPGDQS